MERKTVFFAIALTAVLLSARCDARVRPAQPISATGNAVCSLPSETGMCRASIQSYFYNSATGQCETFTYGGCGGNANRFATIGQCLSTCRPIGAAPAAAGAEAEAAPLQAIQSPACPPRTRPCRKVCPNGFATENNCPICACVVNQNCPALTCPTPCAPGQKSVFDDEGCPTCACQVRSRTRAPRSARRQGGSRGAEKVDCPTNSCFMNCASGFAKDQFGCEICVCASAKHGSRRRTTTAAPPTCTGPQVACAMTCTNGFVKGPDGCDTCTCADESAASTDGQHGHGHGGRKGFITRGGGHHHHQHGGKQSNSSAAGGSPAQIPSNIPAHPAHLPANVAAEGERPAHLPANTRGRTRGGGSPAQIPTVDCSGAKSCRKACPFGNLKDSFGCDLCACRSRPAPGGKGGRGAQGRGTHRAGGHGDGKGSRSGQAAAQPTFPPHCDNKAICRMHCEAGFKAGEDGCPICECRPKEE